MGRLRLPRAADDRRPRSTPAREARGRLARPGADPDRARRRLPAARLIVHRFRRVGARLSLALAAVVAGALAVVWVALVPTLQHRLVAGRLSLLAQSARQIERSETAVPDQDFIDDAARTADANRVVFYSATPAAGSTVLQVLADSRRTGTSLDVQRDPIAQRAAITQALQRGDVTRNGERFAEVAVPQTGGFVLLFAASLRATLRNVELVRERLIWGGLIALGLSILVGFGAASAFARRIHRLERA